MKTISVRLDPNEIAKAIEEIRQYQQDVERKARLLVQKLTDYGAEIARIKIVGMGALATGELLSGVDGYYSPTLNAGFVRVASDHVAFVEFGTGVVGQRKSHRNGEYLSKAAWQYATGSKIFTTQNGKVGWFYPTDDGGVRFTEGMPSRPFMYETAIEMAQVFDYIAVEVFST